MGSKEETEQTLQPLEKLRFVFSTLKRYFIAFSDSQDK